jgi:HAD superfamily hydrolase (TIGR01509 family)
MALFWLMACIVALYFIIRALWYQNIKRQRVKEAYVLHNAHPSTTIFVFDLHHVVIRPDYLRILKKCKDIPQPWKLFLTAFNPYFMYDVIQLVRTSRVPEEYIMVLSAKYPVLRQYIGIGITLLNTQKLIPSTYEVIQKLKKAGFKVYVFSNIGQQTYQELLKQLPELETLFDDIQVASAEQQWLHKPYIDAYKHMLQKFNVKPEHVIFIDNKLSNFTQAEALGIKTLLYESEEQFRKVFAGFTHCE